MWFLRPKSRKLPSPPPPSPELLPPAAAPMRRIEITVERQWRTRVAPDSSHAPVEVRPADSQNDPGPALAAPPDG